MKSETDELLEGLSALGCGVNRSEGAIFVSLPDDFAEFLFDHQGDLLYLGTTLLTPEEFADSDFGRIAGVNMLVAAEATKRTPAAKSNLLGGLHSDTELCINPRNGPLYFTRHNRFFFHINPRSKAL